MTRRSRFSQEVRERAVQKREESQKKECPDNSGNNECHNPTYRTLPFKRCLGDGM